MGTQERQKEMLRISTGPYCPFSTGMKSVDVYFSVVSAAHSDCACGVLRDRGFFCVTWNLVCDREWILSLCKTIFFVGRLTSFFMGPVSDNIGRLPVLLISVLVVEIAGLTLIVTQNVVIFLFCRFFLGFGLQSMQGACATLGTELVEPKDRALIMTAFESAWPLGILLAWLFTRHLHSWVQVQVASMLPTIALLATVRVVTESPRWYFAMRDMDGVRGVILHAAHINRVDEEEVKRQWDSIMKNLPKFQNIRRERVSYFDLVRLKRMRTVVIIMACCWAADFFLYYSLALGNLDSSGMIGAALELPARLSMAIVLTRCSRLTSLKIALLLEAFLQILIFLFQGNYYIAMGAALLARMVATACYTLVGLQTLELCPTLMRNTGFNASSFIGLLGAIFAAFNKTIGEATFRAAPYMVGSVFTVFTAWLIHYLPETRLRELPDTYRDMEEMFEEKNELKGVKTGQEPSNVQHSPTGCEARGKEQCSDSGRG